MYGNLHVSGGGPVSECEVRKSDVMRRVRE